MAFDPALQSPPFAGAPLNPRLRMDDVAMAPRDWAALDMSDERIEQVLAEEREELDPGV